MVKRDGFQTECVSGVPSFCEAAAKLSVPIALGREIVRILPSVPEDGAPDGDPVKNPNGTLDGALNRGLNRDWDPTGNHLIFLKIGKHAGELRDRLKTSGYEVCMAENCGMADEKLYRSADEIPDTAGYFSLMIAAKTRHA